MHAHLTHSAKNIDSHRQRAIVTLQGGEADYVPHFELGIHETERDFDGRTFYGARLCPPLDAVPYDEALRHNAQLYIDVARKYGHSIICLNAVKPQLYPDFAAAMLKQMRHIREQTGDEYLILCHGDATFAIPDGAGLVDFSYRIADDLPGLQREAEAAVTARLALCRRLIQGGIDGFTLCSDYAFNSGPFMSPTMFAKLIAPYLKRLIHEQRAMGAWVIKHSDGNLMPVLDQIMEARPHALHSIDPMAGMDIRLVKERYGSHVALCGNVHCAHMQTGTPEQIIESARYCLTWGKPGGGYFFSTSNMLFRGMPLASYDLILREWHTHRRYESIERSS